MNKKLLHKLAELEGVEVMTMLENATFDSVSPGICTQCEEYTTQVEPDSDSGWCEDCGTNTVTSALVLAGVL